MQSEDTHTVYLDSWSKASTLQKWVMLTPRQQLGQELQERALRDGITA